MKIPDYMRDPERYLWAAIVISLIVLFKDRWLVDSWYWWLFGAVALIITNAITAIICIEVGRKKERYSRYQWEQQVKENAKKQQSAWLRRR